MSNRKQSTLTPLVEASTDDLIRELKRRSFAVLLAVVTVDSKGDKVEFACKGSKWMRENLLFGLEEKFVPWNGDDGEPTTSGNGRARKN